MEKMFNCIIPARGGSKEIPLKNIVQLNGKPLLVYTIQTAKQCAYINKIYVSTDNKKIAKIAEQYGAIVIQRPRKYAKDDTPDRPVLVHAVQTIKDDKDIIYLRPTCPIRNVEILNKAVEYFLKNRDKCTSLKSVNKIKPIYKTFLKKGLYLQTYNDEYYIKKYGQEYFMRPRQLFKQCWEGNSHIDILKPSIFMQYYGHCYGDKILFFETPKSIDIDTIDDIKYLEWQINSNQKEL